MTFKDIVDAVLAGSFDESLRGQAKNWVNHRYQMLWGMEDWAFRHAAVAVGVTSNSMQLASPPADIGQVLSLQDADGDLLLPILDPREFYATYVDPNSPPVGKPEAYTVISGVVLVGPRSNETSSSYQLVYQRALTLLSGDGDVPAFPAGYHLALVHGGKSDGFAMRSMLLFAQMYEGYWQVAVDAMREDQLIEIKSSGDVWSGRYVPELW